MNRFPLQDTQTSCLWSLLRRVLCLVWLLYTIHYRYCAEPFIITLPLSLYDWHIVETASHSSIWLLHSISILSDLLDFWSLFMLLPLAVLGAMWILVCAYVHDKLYTGKYFSFGRVLGKFMYLDRCSTGVRFSVILSISVHNCADSSFSQFFTDCCTYIHQTAYRFGI